MNDPSGRHPSWRYLYSGLAVAFVCLVMVASPLGTWVASRLLVWLAPDRGWQIQVGTTSGWLAVSPTLGQVSVANESLGLSLSADRVQYIPWDRDLELRSVDLRLDLPAPDERGRSAGDSPPISLPTRSLPTIRLVDGALTVQRQGDGTGLRLEGMDVLCQPVDAGADPDSAVSLELSAQRWLWLRQGETRPHGTVAGHGRLMPQAVRVDSLELELATPATRLLALVQADFGLSAGLPVQASVTVRAPDADVADTADAPSAGPLLEGGAHFAILGDLSPLDLAVAVEGQGRHPRLGPMKLTAAGSIVPERLSVGEARMRIAGGEVELTGRYDIPGDQVSVSLNWRDVALAQVSGVAAQGALAGHLRAEGEWKAGRYAGQVEARLAGYDALPGTPLDARVTATLQPDGGVQGTLHSDHGELSIRGRFEGRSAYDLSLAGWLDPQLLLGLHLPHTTVRGQVRPDSATADLAVPTIPVGAGVLGPLDISLLLREGHFLEADLALEGSQAHVQLRTDLRDRQVDALTARLSPLSLNRLNPDLGGSIRGSAKAEGVLDISAARATAQADLGDISWRGWSMGAATVRLQYGVRRLRVEVAGDGVAASLLADSSGMVQGRATLRQANLCRLRPDGPDTTVRVMAQGSVDFAGRPGSPESLRYDVRLNRLAATTPRWGPVASLDSLRLHYARGQGVVAPVTVQTPAGQVHLRHMEWGDTLDVQLAADSLALAPLHPDLAGVGALALRLGGALSAPTATGELAVRDISLKGRTLGELRVGLELGDSLTVRTGLSQTEREGVAPVEALSLLVSGPSGSLRGQGHTGQGLQAHLVGRDLDVGSLLSWALSDSAEGRIDLAGGVELRAGVGWGDIAWGDLNGLLTMTGLRMEKQGLRLGLAGDGARLCLDSTGVSLTGLDLPLEVHRGAVDSFAAAGRMSLSGGVGTGSHLSLRLDQVNLLALERLRAPGVLSLPEGVLDMTAAMDSDGDSTWLAAEARARVEMVGTLAGRVRGGAEHGTGEILWESLAGDSLRVTVDLPWNLAERRVDWRAAGLQAHSAGIDPVVFLDAVPELGRLDGRLRVDVEVDGLAGRPELSGRVDAENLRFCVLDARPDYLYPSGTIEFAGTRGILSGFTGESSTGSGQLELSGFVELASLLHPELSLTLLAQDIPFSYDDVFEVPELDLDLTFSDTASQTLLAGEVRLSGARAQATLLDFNAAPIPRPPAVRNPFLESTQLDVFVDVRDLAAISELSDLTIEGGVRAYGTLSQPRFQGEMAVIEGHVIVLNRTFDFTRGRIVLDKLLPTYSIRELAYDPLLLNPELDLESATRIKTIDPTDTEEYRDVTMTIQGPAQPLAPRFASEGLGDMEIFTLLAFGTTSMPTTADQKQYTTALYTAAGQLLLSRQVSKVGLDEFQLLPVGTVLSTANEPAIRIGKHFDAYLPLWVRYEATTSDPSIGQVRLQYDLNSYLKLTGTAESEFVRYGLGIGLKKDF